MGGRIGMTTDGQSLLDDSLNIDFVMNKNADKLNQLEQLGMQGEGGDLQADQLDQMLVDFLNQNNGPHRNKSSDASALVSPVQFKSGGQVFSPRSGFATFEIAKSGRFIWRHITRRFKVHRWCYVVKSIKQNLR